METYKSQIETIFERQENLLKEYLTNLKQTPILSENNAFDTFSDTFSDGFDVAVSIVNSCGHTKTALKIQTLGSASLKIFSSLNTILSETSNITTASLINPYVGLALGVCSLVGLFSDSDDDNAMECIMDAMYNYTMALSQQMQEYFDITMQRLDNIENKIDQYATLMLREFFFLHRGQENTLEKIFELRKEFINKSSLIQGSLNYVNDSINDKYSLLTSNLEALRTEKINEIVHKAIHDSNKQNLPLETYDKHLDKLYTKATIRAKESHLTGGNIDIMNNESISQVLTGMLDNTTLLSHPIYNNTNLLRKYLNHHFNINYDTVLFNPVIWSQCTDTFTLLLNTHPPKSKTQKHSIINMLRQLCTQKYQLCDFITKIHNEHIVEKLVVQYTLTVEHLKHIFNTLLDTYEKEKTKILKETYRKVREQEIALLTSQSYNCDKQKTLITGMLNILYDSMRPTLDWTKHCRTFTYQGSNSIQGSIIQGYTCHYAGWEKYDALVSRNASQYEHLSKQYITNKINTCVTLLKSDKDAINNLNFHLFKSPDTAIDISMSGVMYPQSDDSPQPILPLPTNGLPLPKYYLIQEQNGRGYIRHEYTYDSSYFYIRSYFITNQDTKKLILEMKHELDSTNSPHYPFEHCQNHWYGGYFAKKTDIFSFIYTYTGYYPGTSWNGVIPPLEPYVGLIDLWYTQAKIVFIDNQTHDKDIDMSCKQLKLDFNNVLIEQLTPGTNFYTTIKQLDAQYKLIDSLMALVYTGDFNILKQPNLLLTLTNEQSIRKYLVDYNNNRSTYDDVHLPQYLTLGNEVVYSLLKHVRTPKLHQDIVKTIERLDVTLHTVELTPITVCKDDNNMLKQKDDEIASLRDEVKELNRKFDLLMQYVMQHK